MKKQTQTTGKKAKRIKASGVTLGIDLGDRSHTVCVLDAKAEVVKTLEVDNEREALGALGRSYPGARIVMECGTHSPWVSRALEELGMEVIVANPRKVKLISQNERKSDHRDAEMLARLGRSDPKLLFPVKHGSLKAQEDMLQIKLRDALVRHRVGLISAVRFTLKSLGYRVSNPASERFHKTVRHEVPEKYRDLIAPVVQALETMSLEIKELERTIVKRAEEDYPETLKLQQIAGVGPITALTFVLKVEDPSRFSKTRDVGAYLGLCPKREQSGNTDKEKRISKCGDGYLRRLLVGSAHYILGPFGRDSALRDYGLRLAEKGSARAKKRAVIAVARKLAVLMLTLWKANTNYQPQPQTQGA